MTRRPKPLELPAVRVQLARAVPLIRALLVIFEDLAADLEVDVGSSLRAEPVREQKIVQVRPRHPTAVNHVESAPAPARVASHPVASQPLRAEVARSAKNGTGLPGGERTTLVAVAQHGTAGVSNNQLSILTGYKRSYRDLCLQKLRSRGYVATADGQHVATPDGRQHLGSSFAPLPTGRALRDHWFAKLPEGERRLLAMAVQWYPNPVPRDEFTVETGYKRSYRDLCLQKLAARRLVEKSGRGSVLAAKMLFD